jgi:glutamyl-tRNA synthetase
VQRIYLVFLRDKFIYMTVITRFAPSPTGMLHIGNVRTAITNWLYAKKHGGKFILRIDDTDIDRSKKEYETAILQNLKWLGLNWDETFSQSSRLKNYEIVKDLLIKSGRLYECYETSEELEIKRKLQLAANKPPLYDRAGLKLTEDQKNAYKAQGRRPHYRFLLNHQLIKWNDMVKGSVSYDASHISDPVLIRENDTMTYMICSTVDDIDYKISHIIRGEDHVTNTAIQIQIFEALGVQPPEFGHLSLVTTKEEKMSKRKGGFEIDTLQNEDGLEPMAINSFLSMIGTSSPIIAAHNLNDLVSLFDIKSFSKSPTTYSPEELLRLNHKLLISLEFEDIKSRLIEIGAEYIDREFWNAVRPNLHKLSDVKVWWEICKHSPQKYNLDQEYLKIAASLLPDGQFTENSWSEWTKAIKAATGRAGKELFMPLRLAITGYESGPELQYILPLISREEITKRLT